MTVYCYFNNTNYYRKNKFFKKYLKLHNNHEFREAAFSLCVRVITGTRRSLTATTRHLCRLETAVKDPPRSRCSPVPPFSGFFSGEGDL